MLLYILAQYFQTVEVAVRGIRNGYIERYEEEVISAERANLRIRIRFVNGHLLELNEAIVAEGEQIKHLGYRYHSQDADIYFCFATITLLIFPLSIRFLTTSICRKK